MKYILSLFLLMAVFSGCATTTYTKPILKGKIENSEIIISARDGSFKISGEFNSPFQSRVYYRSSNISGEKLINGYHRALGFNAKHVLIKVPSYEKEFYGVLVLDSADEQGVGPGSLSYKIIIPQAYIDAAQSGKISVVYEYYNLKDENLFETSNIKNYSWILWLSDEDIFK